MPAAAFEGIRTSVCGRRGAGSAEETMVRGIDRQRLFQEGVLRVCVSGLKGGGGSE